jgi:alpha-1,3-rhamnosyl/mannosyltransferase
VLDRGGSRRFVGQRNRTLTRQAGNEAFAARAGLIKVYAMAQDSLKVCIDMRGVPPGPANGTGVYAVELLRRLPVDACAFVEGPEQRATFETLGIRTIETLAELAGCAVFHRPSQIYDPASFDLFLNSPALPVITCLDLISYRTPALFGGSEAYRRFRGQLFASLFSAQAVLAISEHGRREVLEALRLPPERVHTTHLGVDLPFLSERNPEKNRTVMQRHGIAAPYFFSAGTDLPHKNLGLLLRGYAWLRAIWPGPGSVPALVLIGNRSGAPGGLFDRGPEPAPGVRYLGPVDRDDLPALYQEALALVYPSSYEGFGLPVLEAMAAGIPVLCGRMTALPEVAGDAALYLEDFSMEEFATRMMALATDDALRRRLVKAGRLRARAFSWQETARKTADVYAAVMAQPSREAELHRRAIRDLTASIARTRAPSR